MTKWQRIPNHPTYAVSSDGQICNIHTHRILHLQHNQQQRYSSVSVKLYRNGTYQRVVVARLVANAFLPNPHELPFVCHRDGNRLNNKVTNLIWCNAKNLMYCNQKKRLINMDTPNEIKKK